MHYWPNPSILKSTSSMRKFKANRPKGITDDAWRAMVAEELYNKQLMLDCVPKLSKKEFAPKDK